MVHLPRRRSPASPRPALRRRRVAPWPRRNTSICPASRQGTRGASKHHGHHGQSAPSSHQPCSSASAPHCRQWRAGRRNGLPIASRAIREQCLESASIPHRPRRTQSSKTPAASACRRSRAMIVPSAGSDGNLSSIMARPRFWRIAMRPSGVAGAGGPRHVRAGSRSAGCGRGPGRASSGGVAPDDHRVVARRAGRLPRRASWRRDSAVLVAGVGRWSSTSTAISARGIRPVHQRLDRPPARPRP